MSPIGTLTFASFQVSTLLSGPERAGSANGRVTPEFTSVIVVVPPM